MAFLPFLPLQVCLFTVKIYTLHQKKQMKKIKDKTGKCTMIRSIWTVSCHYVSITLRLRLCPFRCLRSEEKKAPSSCCAVYLCLRKRRLLLSRSARVPLIGRHHPGDDQWDPSVDGEEDARGHSGTAETRRRGQSTGLSGSHAGETSWWRLWGWSKNSWARLFGGGVVCFFSLRCS